MIVDSLGRHRKFAVYGAQVVAYGAYIAIKHRLNRTPECFIVGNLDGNPSSIDSIPVRTLDNVLHDTFIIIGATELLQDEIAETLNAKGYAYTFKLTQPEEHALMAEYFKSIGRFPVVDITAKNPPVELLLYESHCKRDKELKNPPVLKPWEQIIWSDDYPKNPQYCEMSAARWIWENATSEWVGLEHYRRHLLVTPEMPGGDTDAVLPLPYICYPNTIAQFRRFVSEDVLNALLLTLRTLHPNEYGAYLQILNGHYQYTYNLVCAKQEVFDDYCAWFFRITEYMETLVGRAPEIATTRALSYVAEVLTNLYFMSNGDRLKIKHAEKAIYV
jgi:hypothetical protein